METCVACICAQASSVAQECWHQVCSPDRQLHCSGVFNMPHQDTSLQDPLSLNKIRECVKKLERNYWRSETQRTHQFDSICGDVRVKKIAEFPLKFEREKKTMCIIKYFPSEFCVQFEKLAAFIKA